MIQKIYIIFLMLGLSLSNPLWSNPQEQNPPQSDPPFYLRDFAATWLGSLGFDILGTAKLKVRTSLTVRWSRTDISPDK